VPDDAPRPLSKSERLSRSKSERLAPVPPRRARSKSARLIAARSGRRREAGPGPRSGRLTRVPEPPPDAAGRVVAECYEIARPLRRDRLSVVYEATVARPVADDQAGRVALRVVHPQVAGEPGLDRKVLGWAASLCALEHPGIVRVREYGHEDGVLYLALDACDGRPLADVLREEEALPPGRALAVFRQACEAVAAAHAQGLVHQRLGPGCLLLEGDAVRLTDFAVTSPEDALGADVVPLDVGSAKYASPELAAGARQDERSDIYALGLILYELLSGELPFEGFFADQLLEARVGRPAPPVAARAPEADVPPGLEAVLQRALAPDPDERFPSVEALLQALDAGGEAPEEEPEPEPEPLEVLEELSLPGLRAGLRAALTQEPEGVALTWLLETPARRKKLLEEFEGACDAALRVDHPHLAPLIGYGPRGPRQLMARSRWGGGATARARIARGPLPPAELAPIARPLLEALSVAHTAGVTHGALDPRLIELEPELRLHGLGVAPVARRAPAPPEVDVRDAAFVFLQLLSGLHLDEAGPDTVRTRGLERASGPLARALETATGADPFADAGRLLDALEQDPGFRPRDLRPLALLALIPAAVVLAVGVAVVVAVRDPDAATASPRPSAPASPGRSEPPPPPPTGSAPPSPTAAERSAATPEPSASEVPADPPALGAPAWFHALPAALRPPLPLPPGVAFGDDGGYALRADGSPLVFLPVAGAFVGEREVTWDQYLEFCQETDRSTPVPAFEAAEPHPVHGVSWDDAAAYCAWAGARLPTDAEWSEAAGAGRYPWGDAAPDPTRANLSGAEDGFPHTSPAGAFPAGASPLGCLDLAGNVAEWVADPVGDGERGVRGGGWSALAWECRVGWRGHAPPERRLSTLGFRLALDAE